MHRSGEYTLLKSDQGPSNVGGGQPCRLLTFTHRPGRRPRRSISFCGASGSPTRPTAYRQRRPRPAPASLACRRRRAAARRGPASWPQASITQAGREALGVRPTCFRVPRLATVLPPSGSSGSFSRSSFVPALKGGSSRLGNGSGGQAGGHRGRDGGLDGSSHKHGECTWGSIGGLMPGITTGKLLLHWAVVEKRTSA